MSLKLATAQCLLQYELRYNFVDVTPAQLRWKRKSRAWPPSFPVSNIVRWYVCHGESSAGPWLCARGTSGPSWPSNSNIRNFCSPRRHEFSIVTAVVVIGVALLGRYREIWSRRPTIDYVQPFDSFRVCTRPYVLSSSFAGSERSATRRFLVRVFSCSANSIGLPKKKLSSI